MDMVRSVLKNKEMPVEFWAEAVQCAVYIQIRCIHSRLGNKTPQEMWNGRKPTAQHMKVFGRIAYTHVPNQKRRNLMIKVRNWRSSDMIRRQKDTSFLIQIKIRL